MAYATKHTMNFIALSVLILLSTVLVLQKLEVYSYPTTGTMSTAAALPTKSTTLNLPIIEEESMDGIVNQTVVGNTVFPTKSLNLHEPIKVDSMSMSMSMSMDDIMNRTKQVFITMPAKAAGSSMKYFTRQCTKSYPPDNFINHDLKNLRKKTFFADNYELPSIIASHLYNDAPLVHLVKSSTRKTLIIYIHRDESERLISGIKMVLMSRICNFSYGDPKKYGVERNGSQCILDEEPVIDLIERKEEEIGFGASNVLTCDAYKSIEENAPPHMLFVHYKQANKLQKLLAKHHCPDLLEAPALQRNVATDKQIEVSLRIKNSTKIVKLSEWFDKKQGWLEWALNMRKEASCQSKTRDMEDVLFSCPDGAVKLFKNEWKCIRLVA